MAQCAERVVRAGIDAGMERAWELINLTPREVENAFAAEAARREQAAERMDLLACLIGRYAMIAVHAPRRYPDAPNGIVRAPRAMSDDEMRRALISIAQRREAIGGS